MQVQSLIKSMTIAALIAAGAVLVQPSAVQASGPFSQLSGTWNGSGQVRFDQGKTEQISCKAYYTLKAEGSGLGLAIRCASSSYKIEMRAVLNFQGQRVTGQWEERTFNAEGSLNGHASERGLTLAITGGVSGSMALTIGQSGHRVDIKATTAGLTGVSIDLTRG
jgi:hypothetical protein